FGHDLVFRVVPVFPGEVAPGHEVRLGVPLSPSLTCMTQRPRGWFTCPGKLYLGNFAASWTPATRRPLGFPGLAKVRTCQSLRCTGRCSDPRLPSSESPGWNC